MREALALVLMLCTLYGVLSLVAGVVGVFRRVRAAAEAQATARAVARADARASARGGDTTVVVGAGVDRAAGADDYHRAAAVFFGATGDDERAIDVDVDHDDDRAVGAGAAGLGPGERPGDDPGPLRRHRPLDPVLRRRVPADRRPVVTDQ